MGEDEIKLTGKLDATELRQIIDVSKRFVKENVANPDMRYITFYKEGLATACGPFAGACFVNSFDLPQDLAINLEMLKHSAEMIPIEGNVEVEFLDDDRFQLKWEGVKYTSEIYPAPEFDIIIPEPDQWSKLPEGFIDWLKEVAFCVIRDIRQPAINSIYINKGEITSTDNRRVYTYKHADPELAKIEDLFIPLRLFELLDRLDASPSHFAQTEDHIYLKYEAQNYMVFSSSQKYTYPNTAKAYARRTKESLFGTINFPSRTLEILQQATPVFKHHNDRLRISLTENKMTAVVCFPTPSKQEVTLSLDVTYSNKQPIEFKVIEFDVDAFCLRDMIERFSDIELHDKFLYAERGNAKHMVVLVNK